MRNLPGCLPERRNHHVTDRLGRNHDRLINYPKDGIFSDMPSFVRCRCERFRKGAGAIRSISGHARSLRGLYFHIAAKYGTFLWKSRRFCDIVPLTTIGKKDSFHENDIPLTPENVKAAGGSPFTGDESNIALWIVIAVIALAAIIGIIVYLTKRRR